MVYRRQADQPLPDDDEPSWPTLPSKPLSRQRCVPTEAKTEAEQTIKANNGSTVSWMTESNQESPMVAAIDGLSAGQRDVCAAVREVKKDVAEIMRFLKVDLGDLIRADLQKPADTTREKRKTKHVHHRGTVLQHHYFPEYEPIHEEIQRKRKTQFDLNTFGEIRKDNSRDKLKKENSDSEPRTSTSEISRIAPELRQGLELTLAKPTTTALVPAHTYYMPATTTSQISSGSVVSGNRLTARLAVLIQDPSSIKRIAYCMCSLVMLLFDLAVIPYVLALTLPFTNDLMIATYMTCTFWTVDIFMSFLTGFYKNGELELTPHKVIWHYAKGRFVPDVIIVLLDWVSIYMVNTRNEGRYLRVFGVVRAYKITQDVAAFIENLSNRCRNILNTVLIFLLALWFNHWVACVWIFIGRLAPTETGNRWADHEDYIELDALYRYSIAFQWSCGQFMMTDTDIGFYNTIECIFTLLCQLGGMLIISTLVSTLSGVCVMWHLEMSSQKHRKRRLQQFLEQNHIERRMYVDIQRQVMDRERRPTKLVEGDVDALQDLSEPMLQKLRVEICRPHIETSPLFWLWFSLDPGFVHRMCYYGIDLTVHRPQDHLFSAGDKAFHMYHIIRGRYAYCNFSEFNGSENWSFPDEKWLSEPALWTEWVHVGTAKAESALEVLRVAADKVISALKDCQRNSRNVTLEYCNAYYKRLVSAMPSCLPTDLTSFDYSELIGSMSQDTQITVGVAAVDLAQDQQAHRSWLAGKDTYRGLDRLKEEICKGKSTVLLNDKGKLERFTMLVALKIQREDGKILVQLLKAESDQCATKPCCQLPGAKQTQGESVRDAATRVFRQKLTLLAGNPVHIQDNTLNEKKDSNDYGVPTKYLKTEMLYKLQGPPNGDGIQDIVSAASSVHRKINGYESFSLKSGRVTKDYYAWMTEKQWHASEKELKELHASGNAQEVLGHWLQEPRE